jgi:serine/threonine-protein kinase ATR
MSQVTLPAEDLDYSVFSQQKDSSPHLVPRYAINEATHAFWHVNHLLTILVDTSVEAVSSFDATPAFQDYIAWILDSFPSVHELQKRWQANPQLQQSCIDSCLPSFRAVELLLSSVGEELSPTVLRKGYLLFSILCSDLLGMPDALQETSNQFHICRGVLSLVAICKRHDSMRGAVALHLLPAITTTILDENARKKLGKDFQVRNPATMNKLIPA